MDNETVFTDFESDLYDRQIRLWGAEAQKRLNDAKILIIGMNGLGAELAKNVILGGVKSVVLMDHKLVTKLDFANQFLLPQDSIGQNRAAASLIRAQVLNPMVDVTASCSSPEDKLDKYFEQFTVICAIGCTKTQIIRLNRIARKLNVKFFAGDVFGFYSYIFSDLGPKHYYTKEIVIQPTKNTPGETKIVHGITTFCPFQEILEINWSKASARLLKKTKPSVHAVMVFLEFLEKHKYHPQPGSQQDAIEVFQILSSYLLSNGLPDTILSPSGFMNYVGQLSPVCAISGGVLAQEVVKAISGKDEPITNFFIYDPVHGTGIVEKFSRLDSPELFLN